MVSLPPHPAKTRTSWKTGKRNCSLFKSCLPSPTLTILAYQQNIVSVSQYFRILNTGSHVPWFGEDGKLVALPNPIQRKATRPPNFEDTMSDDVEQSLTFFCPPSLPGPDGTPAPIQNSGRMASITQCQLEASINKKRRL